MPGKYEGELKSGIQRGEYLDFPSCYDFTMCGDLVTRIACRLCGHVVYDEKRDDPIPESAIAKGVVVHIQLGHPDEFARLEVVADKAAGQ